MTGEPEPAGTMAADASLQVGPKHVTGTDSPSPMAGSALELLIRELGAILAGWGVTEQDDDILAPLADSLAGLLAAGLDNAA